MDRRPPRVLARLLPSMAVPAVVLAAAATLWSCGGDGGGPTGTVEVSLEKESGDGQAGAVSSPLLAPLEVKVVNQSGAPVSGRSVAWSVTAGTATLSATSSTSNASGIASVEVTLGSTAGAVTVTATLGSETVQFGATALVPSGFATTGAANPNGRTLEAFPEPLAVRVTAAGNVPVPGVTVAWDVTSGGATLSASSTRTGADGIATVTVTGGTQIEDVVVEASIAALPASVISFDLAVTVLVIDMINTAFRGPTGGPAVTVAAGDTVEWFNRDVAIGAHTATSTSTPAGGSPFDSGNMAVNARFRFVPDAVGTWDYFCEIHGNAMSGTLTAN